MQESLQPLIFGIVAVLCAWCLTFVLTPLVRVFAYRIKAVDVPRDKRRMHNRPIPRIGGLAIYLSIAITLLVFCKFDNTVKAILIGGGWITLVGLIDDRFGLNAWLKLLGQLIGAGIAIWQNVGIRYIFIGGKQIEFGWFAIPITILWILALTNAMNLIDGLDGLACGISAISAAALFAVALIFPQPQIALITALVAASSLGFLPFNVNPAKIFMGDSGALFLGYAFAILSINGVFKLHAMIAFLVPLFIFALPLFDTVCSFFRRLFKGKHPFAGDTGHIHHRLIDMGFGHRQTARILYAICALFGIAAVSFTSHNYYKCGLLLGTALLVCILLFLVFRNPKTREQTGIVNNDLPDTEPPAIDSMQTDTQKKD